MNKVLVSTIALMGWAMAGFSTMGIAEEVYPGPHEAGPTIYTQLFDNEKTRVNEIKFNPGESIPMHTHAYDHFVYVLEAGQLTLSHPDGTTNVVDGVVGQVMWLPKETHAAVNTGPTVFRALVVEIKS